MPMAEHSSLQIWTLDAKAHELEDRIAKDLFSEDPEGSRGLVYQEQIEGGRAEARRRVALCLDPKGDTSGFTRSPLFSGKRSPKAGKIQERLDQFFSFRDMVRQRLSNAFLIGNITIHNASLNQDNPPTTSFTVYRHPTLRGDNCYDFEVCMNMLTGEMLMGLTKNQPGDHLYTPITLNGKNLDSVLAKLAELGQSSEEVDRISQDLHAKFKTGKFADVWGGAALLRDDLLTL